MTTNNHVTNTKSGKKGKYRQNEIPLLLYCGFYGSLFGTKYLFLLN